MQSYQILGRIGEGTFSEVLKAQDKNTKMLVAIKCMKKRFKSIEQVNHLREVQCIRRIQSHPNIIKFVHVLFDRLSGRLALVFEFMDMSLYDLIKSRREFLPEEQIAYLMYQILKGIEHIHSRGLVHRDVKPENLLVNIEDTSLKIADFGSARSSHGEIPFTEYISTRWYRAPECLLTSGYYKNKMDIWSAGCVFFELCTLHPLFPGTNELDQIHKIHNVLGTPPPELLATFRTSGSNINIDFTPRTGSGLVKLVPNLSPNGVDLMKKLLAYDEKERCTAKEALNHPYFKRFRDLEPTQGSIRHKQRHHSSKHVTLALKERHRHEALPNEFPNSVEKNLGNTLARTSFQRMQTTQQTHRENHLPYIETPSMVDNLATFNIKCSRRHSQILVPKLNEITNTSTKNTTDKKKKRNSLPKI